MTKLKWWMRVVGVFDLLQAIGNFYAIYLYYTAPEAMAGFLRPSLQGIEDAALAAQYADVWLVYILDLVVIGIALIAFSRDPARHLALVCTVIGFELIHGLVGDVIWIALGYPPSRLLVGIGIHLLIALTGIFFARGVARESGIAPA
jgi:hypothetical protein